MEAVTEQAKTLRAAVLAHRDECADVLIRYGASNPRVFGSVARGDAHAGSDVDVFVDLDSTSGNPLLRVAGIGEELSCILGVRVDVVAESLLRASISATAHRDMIPL